MPTEIEPRDVVLRVPQQFWLNWLAEGDHPGDEPTETWGFSAGNVPVLPPGSRCYVTCYGLVRGYAPVVAPEPGGPRVAFLRRGGAVAVTVPGLDLRRGRWSWRYRCWEREEERPFDDRWGWAMAGLPERLERDVHILMIARQDPVTRAELKRRALAGALTGDALLVGLPISPKVGA